MTATADGIAPDPGSVPVGKLRCFVTGKLRKESPEEHVRQRWARSLVEEYGYNVADLDVEFPVTMGTARKRADIVVFPQGAAHDQDTAMLIVEVKRENISPADKIKGVDQLKSYMSACSSCRFGLWVGSEKLAFEKTNRGALLETTDIPLQGQIQPQPPLYSNLRPATDLSASLRRCHNYIYANAGMQKSEAFHELQKLIFCKVLDETDFTSNLRFYVSGRERTSTAGQHRLINDRIEPLFDEVRIRYPYIFATDDRIKLDLKSLAYIVSELQRYSLLSTQTDIKGSAYEELVGANLRGDRGEYFTPRNVCDMTIRMVLSLHSDEQIRNLKIFDCCCGTGGFLVSAVNQLRAYVTDWEQRKGGTAEEVRHHTANRVKEMAERNLFGMDINPILVRTTQMNLVMHGDGSANVFQGNTLAAPGEWEDHAARAKISDGRFDVVVTNPPFGGKAHVDDPHILSRYELPSQGQANPRSRMPSEQLFVEAALKYVKRGGYLAIVLPRSIANNPGLEFIRRWLTTRSRVLASIDLPKETFGSNGGVPNPTVLIVQRLTEEEERLAQNSLLEDYEIFMSIPTKVGIDKRGNSVYARTAEGDVILDAQQQPIVEDHLPQVVADFCQWHGSISHYV